MEGGTFWIERGTLLGLNGAILHGLLKVGGMVPLTPISYVPEKKCVSMSEKVINLRISLICKLLLILSVRSFFFRSGI